MAMASPTAAAPRRVRPPTTYALRNANLEASRTLASECGIGCEVAQVLLHRGIFGTAGARNFLEPRLSELSSPESMADRHLAAERLTRACRSGERVAVFGDYDVDGMTSCALLSDTLRRLGADTVALVADRFSGGYGLSDSAWERCHDSGARLWVTCDCGSSDHARLERARQLGIEVIVVDHHLVPSEPLPALAFLNPHRPDCGFDFKWMCSAGLALSLAAAVRKSLGSDLDLRGWLDLVALGTIADVAPLHGDNRCLARAGLRQLAASPTRPGMAALRQAAGLEGKSPLSAFDVAFRLAPRLNAAGRLGKTDVALRLLLANDSHQAAQLAAELEAINQERKGIEQQVSEAATIQALEVYGEAPDTGIVVGAEGWHRGVVGITAARLVERFDVPVVVIGFDGELGHGSGRTPRGLPLYDAIAACRDNLERFGGHQAASGVTLRRQRLEAFRAAFAAATGPLVQERLACGGSTIDVDVLLDGTDSALPSCRELALLEPCGEGNPAPMFGLADAQIEAKRILGSRHLKLDLRLGRQRLSAIGWDLGHLHSQLPGRCTLYGQLQQDSWRGGEQLELQLHGWSPS